jgi:hypothetical protein
MAATTTPLLMIDLDLLDFFPNNRSWRVGHIFPERR